VTLRQFSDSDSPADATIHISLSEYSPTYVNVDERRARLRAQLVNSGGGPLGVVDVKEVVIGAVDVEMARRSWRRLLDPTPSATPDTWQIGSGPAVRLVPANENCVQALLIRGSSLQRARTFLREKQLLGIDAAGQVTIEPSKVGGLDLRLVERQPRFAKLSSPPQPTAATRTSHRAHEPVAEIVQCGEPCNPSCAHRGAGDTSLPVAMEPSSRPLLRFNAPPRADRPGPREPPKPRALHRTQTRELPREPQHSSATAVTPTTADHSFPPHYASRQRGKNALFSGT
jgi:hypothetical protein